MCRVLQSKATALLLRAPARGPIQPHARKPKCVSIDEMSFARGEREASDGSFPRIGRSYTPLAPLHDREHDTPRLVIELWRAWSLHTLLARQPCIPAAVGTSPVPVRCHLWVDKDTLAVPA